MTNQRLTEELRQQGWSIIQADSIQILEGFRAYVEETIRENFPEECGVESLLESLTKMDSATLNSVSKITHFRMRPRANELLHAFKTPIIQTCGTEVFFQQSPYLRCNVPLQAHTATPPHCDVHYGHSPYAFTLWIPWDNVSDESGIYLFNQEISKSIISKHRYDWTIDSLIEAGYPKPKAVQLQFGEGILFKANIIHGSYKNMGRKLRMSLDTRIQSVTRPLFEKGLDVYGLEVLNDSSRHNR